MIDTGFGAAYAAIQTTPFTGRALPILARQYHTAFCTYYNSMAQHQKSLITYLALLQSRLVIHLKHLTYHERINLQQIIASTAEQLKSYISQE